MKPLSSNDIESELSYAYLHAVASRAGAGCEFATRHEDNHGIDAKITAWGPFPNGGYIEEVDLKVQLKATIENPSAQEGYLPYFLKGINRFNDLRKETLATHRILVVMFLPNSPKEWLHITEDELIMRKCAYWVSLRSAKASQNSTGETIYIPSTQVFTPESLLGICARLSRREILNYQLP